MPRKALSGYFRFEVCWAVPCRRGGRAVQRNCQYLWIGVFSGDLPFRCGGRLAEGGSGVMSVGRSEELAP